MFKSCPSLGFTLLGFCAFVAACGGGAQNNTAQIPITPSSEAPKPEPGPASESGPISGGACIELATARREKRPDEPSKITAKHILIRYAGSKNAGPEFTRTREQACLRAIEARDEIRKGADFDAMVEKYSDEPGAASRHGSIGSIDRTMVIAPFADAAFELDRGQLSDVVETDFGFHVILRTD